MRAVRSTTGRRAVAAAKALDPARFDEAALKAHAIGEAASIVSAIPEVRDGAVRLPARFCRRAARRGARRARHRHRDLPGRRCEDLRHRGAGGARAPPRARAAGRRSAGRRGRDPGRHPAARRARPHTASRRWFRRADARIASIPPHLDIDGAVAGDPHRRVREASSLDLAGIRSRWRSGPADRPALSVISYGRNLRGACLSANGRWDRHDVSARARQSTKITIAPITTVRFH